MPATDPKRVEQYLRNATVKLYVDGNFTGTGFFISPDGYVLTAHHCVGSTPQGLELETLFDGRVTARIEPDKSLSAYDLAVLKSDYLPSHYVPLGKITTEQVSDRVVTVGYPASHLRPNHEVGTYQGYISRWRDDDVVELSDVIKGKGHSGGLVYHYGLARVVGVVTDRYLEGIMVDSGLATRLDRLFAKWPELEDRSRRTAEQWDRRLQSLRREDNKHPIVLALLPDDEAATSLLAALRAVFEDQWGCQVLTIQDRQYGDSALENLRTHLEQAAVVVAEVSRADPAVMFMLGAAQFALSNVPTVLLTEAPGRLPQPLQGRLVVPYAAAEADLATTLEAALGKLAPLQPSINEPGREHFLSLRRLRVLSRLPLDEKAWRRIHERYPTREAWRDVSAAALANLLGAESDLAEILLKRVREGRE